MRQTKQVLMVLALVLSVVTVTPAVVAAERCHGVSLRVLGSGGPELDDGRNSSGFAILKNDKAKILVDAGMGTSREFERLKLHFNDVEAILITHLHVDHVDDLAIYFKGGFFTGRADDLLIYGPSGNQHLPSMKLYIKRLLDKNNGLYPYLHRQLPEYAGEYNYRIKAQSASAVKEEQFVVNDEISVASVPTSHGPLPSVAWRVNVGECSLAFMGDTGAKALSAIAKLAKKVDLLVLNMPLEIGAPEPAQALHMVPEDLAKLAKKAKPRKVLLAHFMKRSLRELEENAALIGRAIKGELLLAEDGMRVDLGE